jgi:Carboxypeptidase regulatory-like domain
MRKAGYGEDQATRRVQIVVRALVCAFAACCGRRAIPSRALRGSGPDSVARCVPEYPQLVNAVAKLPTLPEPQGVGDLVVIGYVADSATGHGLSGARVLLRPATQRWHDTAYTDAAAGFVFSSVKRGSYEYMAQAMNFQAGRGSIEISSKAETLRIRLRRAGLCGITIGPLLEPIVRKPPPPR